MTKKLLAFIVLCSLVFGGISGWLIMRFVIPSLNTIPFLVKYNLAPSASPLVINTREEVRVNEGSDSIAAIQKVKSWQVGIQTGTDALHSQIKGSGLIITSDGLIATTKAVFPADTTSVNVVFQDGKVLPGTLKAQDPASDLIFIKVDANNLPTASFGNPRDLKLGQRIILLSASLTQYQANDLVSYLSSETRDTKTNQVLSSEKINDSFGVDDIKSVGQEGVQEGSMIISLDGQVQGLFSGSGVITSDAIRSAMGSFFDFGKIRRNYFGINYVYVPKSLSNLYSLPEGVIVQPLDLKNPGVIPGGPAQKAGLLEGDIITRVDDVQIDFDNSFEFLVNKHNPGDNVRLRVERGPANNRETKVINLVLESK